MDSLSPMDGDAKDGIFLKREKQMVALVSDWPERLDEFEVILDAAVSNLLENDPHVNSKPEEYRTHLERTIINHCVAFADQYVRDSEKHYDKERWEG